MGVQEKAVKEFQRQHLVDLGGVVPVSIEMAPHHGFEPIPFEIWPGKCPWVEQHLANVLGQDVPVPHTIMGELVPAQEEPFEAEGERR